MAAATLGIGVYQRTFGADAVAQHRLDRLAVNLQIDRFIDRLGKPDLINSDGTFTERLFIDSRFFVDAIATRSDKVVFYSVTARRASFHPLFRQYSHYGPCYQTPPYRCPVAKVRLGASRPSSIEAPFGLTTYWTMGGGGYVESYGGDHADDFLYFIFGNVQAGSKFADYTQFQHVADENGGQDLAVGQFAPDSSSTASSSVSPLM